MQYEKYDKSQIRARLKFERKALKMSQDELAEKLHLNRNTIGAWEKDGIPSLDDMLKMCNIFDCELGYLLCEHDCKTKKKTDINEALGLSSGAADALERTMYSSMVGNRMLNLLLENGFEYALAELLTLFTNYLSASHEEKTFHSTNPELKEHGTLYNTMFNALTPRPESLPSGMPAFTMLLNSDSFLDIRLQQIFDRQKDVVKTLFRNEAKKKYDNLVSENDKISKKYKDKYGESLEDFWKRMTDENNAKKAVSYNA